MEKNLEGDFKGDFIEIKAYEIKSEYELFDKPKSKTQSKGEAPNPKRERGIWTLGCL